MDRCARGALVCRESRAEASRRQRASAGESSRPVDREDKEGHRRRLRFVAVRCGVEPDVRARGPVWRCVAGLVRERSGTRGHAAALPSTSTRGAAPGAAGREDGGDVDQLSRVVVDGMERRSDSLLAL